MEYLFENMAGVCPHCQANAAMVFNAILLLTAIGIALYAAVAAVERLASLVKRYRA